MEKVFLRVVFFEYKHTFWISPSKKFNPHSFIAPLDFSWAIQNWFKKIKIKGLVLIEAEIWYNTISLAAKKCPVVLVNGRVQKKEGLNRILYKKLIRQFSLILASNQSTYDFYRSLKLDEQQQKTKIAYSGNLKFASSTKNHLNTYSKKTTLKKTFSNKNRS